MKLRKIVALVLALIMVFSCTLTAFAADSQENKTFNYVALGDSIASGFGLTDPNAKISVESIAADPALILSEDLLAHPVANAYPALFGDELQKLGAERGVDVKTSNLSMSAYRASDVAQVLSTEGYVSDFSAFAIDYYLKLDTSGLAKYHDITVNAVKDADLVSVNLGGNDILINAMYDMYKKNNPVLNAVSMALFMTLVGADRQTTMELVNKEIEKSENGITVDDITEAAKLLGGFRASAKAYTASAIENVRSVVDNVKAINPDTDIAVVNMYSPFGNSLEYDGQVLDLSTVLTNIFKKAAAQASGSDIAVEDVELLPTGAAEDKIDDLLDNAEELDQIITDGNGSADDKSARVKALLSIIASEVSYPLQYLTIGKAVDSRVQELNEGLKGVAADTGSSYVDIHNISNENNMDPHPTAEGHREIADILTATLAEKVFPGCFDKNLEMTAGDVLADFAEAGTACVSSDPSVAWVDENGALNAMKPGTALITNGKLKYTVTVGEYSDGTGVAGNLKILARYNDSMQFYDGHVYLLFTSYQDGVTINVPDLYAGYEIEDFYYPNIREDISVGSNHTDKDADGYFKLNKDMKSVTLNRGEIVTIGMYRDFDLTVPQAALGSVENSSAWSEVTAAGKAAVVKNVFGFLENGKISTDEFVARIKEIAAEVGVDYNKLLDGVVDGGVCFNRELYNQKLEWDQFENVTYEMDITNKQLNTMAMYLGGNNGKFSILKNSCATVALRAWNAAVGTRNGEKTAHYLTAEADGIFKLIDAPKGVRDNIVKRLPGYYLNNAQGVAEPNASFEDETGYVYVSAPEIVTPVEYNYTDTSVEVEDLNTSMTDLVNAAKAGQNVMYNKDSQKINVTVKDNDGVISGIDFDINGKTVTLDGTNIPGDGIWFKTSVDALADGESYYVTDAEGKTLASDYFEDDGVLAFHVDSLPQSYRTISTSDGAQNILRVSDKNNGVSSDVEVYYYKDGVKTVVNNSAAVKEGTKIYVKAAVAENELDHIINSIHIGGDWINDDDHYDAAEGAYFGTMPGYYTELEIEYATAKVTTEQKNIIQIFKGDRLNVDDYAHIITNDEPGYALDMLKWKIVDDQNGALTVDGNELAAVKEGTAIVWACAKGNENIGIPFSVEVGSKRSDYVSVSFNGEAGEEYFLYASGEDVPSKLIPYSGYLIEKGSDVALYPAVKESKALFAVLCNGKALSLPEDDAGVASAFIKADTDLDFAAAFADAEIKNMPKEINLTSSDDTYQLEAYTRYKGILSIVAPYDGRLTYTSSDSLIDVDENGLITVTGDIPENGAAVYVTAYAGSSNGMVYAATRVVVGDYDGDRIVGRLTIHARPIHKGELVAHGALTYTTYEDTDLDVSYYEYYKPNDKYNDLMRDYADHPEKYSSDPAVYNDNELEIEDREYYFDVTTNGPESEPATISLKSGESFTVSNYSFDDTHMDLLIRALENGDIQNSSAAQALVYQMYQYKSGGEVDTDMAFNGLVGTFAKIIKDSREYGENPANGHSIGGICIDREIYNQFRSNNTQLPNNYYSVDITAEEFERMKAYLANPENNYYSIFTMNCGTGVTKLWNTILSDKPELNLKANYTGVSTEPESLNINIGLLTAKDLLSDYDGEGGVNFIPRTLAHKLSYNELIEAIDALGEVEVTDEYKAKLDELKAAYDELNDTEKTFITNSDKLIDALNAYNEAKLAQDKEAFEEYKNGAVEKAAAMLKEDDNPVSKALVELFEKAIGMAEYDETKSLEENEAMVDAALKVLADSLEKQRLIDEEVRKAEEFEAYKKEAIDAASAMLNENDSIVSKSLAEIAKFAVAVTEYDPEKTPDENKAVIDASLEALSAALDKQRELEKNIAEFEEYKASALDAADALLNEDDTVVSKALVEIVKAGISAIPYDPEDTPENNRAVVDETLEALKEAVETQRLAEKDKVEYGKYKASVLEAADALINEDDSVASKTLVKIVKAAIAVTPYDDEKTLEENKAILDEALEALKEALENQRELEKNIADFEEYKASVLEAADALVNEDDSPETKLLADLGKSAIESAVYDPEKTLDENKAALDEALKSLEEALDAQRELEKNIADFEEYKASVSEAAGQLANEDDDLATKIVAALGKAAIDNAPYDPDKTPEENKAALDELLKKVTRAVEKQRILEHPILGDADVTGEVDIIDATFIQRDLANIEMPEPINDFLADVDMDGFVSIVDATLIQSYLNDFENPYLIGEHILVDPDELLFSELATEAD